jgi:hypothetical protein
MVVPPEKNCIMLSMMHNFPDIFGGGDTPSPSKENKFIAEVFLKI